MPYERLRWHVFKNDDGASMFQNIRMNVFPFIKNLNSGRASAYSRFMENSGGTDRVWFYNMRADGFSLDDKRNPVSDNDIPDIIHRFEHSFHNSRTL